ncbi:MAG: type IX secretion system sortase PorU [Balneolales bacterium]
MTLQVNAQHLRKITETAEFIDYRLLNDSLVIAPANELMIPYKDDGENVRVLEQEIVPVNLPDEQKDFLDTYFTQIVAGNDKPVLEILDPGYHRKQRVASLKVHSSRQDVDNNMRFHVIKRLTFRVFKHSSVAPYTQMFSTQQQMPDSPLNSGTWYKIPINKDGIYRIDSGYLDNLGITASNIDPENIQLWGTNGYALPAINSESRPEFSQIPILVSGQSDGDFGSNDFILFYGNSPDREIYNHTDYSFTHELHPFSTENYVYLTVGNEAGLRINESGSSGNPTREIDRFHDFIWLEEDLYKSEPRIKSGIEWFGKLFSPQINSSQTILYDTIPGYIPNTEVQLKIKMGARSESSSRFDLRINQTPLNPLPINAIFSSTSSTGPSARVATLNQTLDNLSIPDDILEVSATFVPSISSAQGWVDWIQVRLHRRLEANNNKLIFYAPEDGDAGETARYSLIGFSSTPRILDVSDPVNPILIPVTGSTNSIEFNYATQPGTRFIAQSTPYTPRSGERVVNQNLRGISDYPDYIIVTDELFLEEAHELAEYRRDNDGLRPVVVTQEQIFNEFSGGVPDMRATRDYLKFLFDRADSPDQLPAYLLFFGDATYDFKNIEGEAGNNNYVFTYQSQESIDRIGSFGSDDYYGLLADGEGEWAGRSGSTSFERVDIGIGRLPIQTNTDAQVFIDKIKSYENQDNRGDWRTLFSFAADDDVAGRNNDRDLHTLNANGTANQIDREATGIRLNKIYQFSYPVENTSSGRRLPLANDAFIDRINNGTLIMNYSGHGNERVLSDELLFSVDDIPRFTNRDKLSILVTATCSFGRYDDTENQSGAELTMLYPDGGMVASFTTTRVVYTGTNEGTDNYGLNIELTRQMVQREEDGQPRRLGDIYRITKNSNVGRSFNSRKFILLGDPAMRIGLPTNNIRISKINGQEVSDEIIPLRALDRVLVEGEVIGSDQNINTSFTGEATLRTFDVERFVNYPDLEWVRNESCFISECGYGVQNDILFNGRVSVKNGRFSSEFIVPKDISYSDNKGMIQVYAQHATSDAVGAFSNFTLNGRNPDAIDNEEGPQIEIFLNDETFFNGSLVNNSPKLIAQLTDETGINTGGGVGHEIVAILTKEPQTGSEQTIILNEFYQSEIDDFTKGRIEYPISDLEEGRYRLQLRAFDVFNNLGEEEISFEVADSRKLEIANMYNYPNPMHNFTQFMFEHNQQGNPMDISIRIYTLSGRPVAHIERESFISPSNLARIEWDGRDEDNHMLATGTYLYHIKIRTETIDGRQSIDKIERLVVVR